MEGEMFFLNSVDTTLSAAIDESVRVTTRTK